MDNARLKSVDERIKKNTKDIEELSKTMQDLKQNLDDRLAYMKDQFAAIFAVLSNKSDAEKLPAPPATEIPSTSLGILVPQALRDAVPNSAAAAYNSVEEVFEVRNLPDYEGETMGKQILGVQSESENGPDKVLERMTISVATDLQLFHPNYIIEREYSSHSFSRDEVSYLLSNSPSLKPGNLLIDRDFQPTTLRIGSVEVTHNHLFDEMAESFPAETGNQLVNEVGQPYSLKLEHLGDTRHVFNEMPFEPNIGIGSHEALVLPVVGMLRLFGRENEATKVSLIIDSSKPRIEGVAEFVNTEKYEMITSHVILVSKLAIGFLLGKMSMFIFDPGGSSLYRMGCLSFKISGDKQDFDFWANMIHVGSSYAIGVGRFQLSKSIIDRFTMARAANLFSLVTIWALGRIHVVKAITATILGLLVDINAAKELAWLLSSLNAHTLAFGSKFFREFDGDELFALAAIKPIMCAKLLVASMAGILGRLGIVLLAEAIKYCSCAVCVPENKAGLLLLYNAHTNVVYALNINFGSSLASIASSQMDCVAEFFFTMPTFNFPAIGEIHILVLIGKVVSGMNGLLWSFNTIAQDEEVAKQCSWGYVHHLGEGYLVKPIIISELDGFIHVWQDKMFASVNYIADCFSIGSVLDLNEVPSKVARVFAKPSAILLKAMLEVPFAFKRRETLFYIFLPICKRTLFGIWKLEVGFVNISVNDLRTWKFGGNMCKLVLLSSRKRKSVLAMVTTLEHFVWDPGQCAIFVYILEDKDVFKRVGKRIVHMDITWVIMETEHMVKG